MAHTAHLSQWPVLNLRVAYFGQYRNLGTACFDPQWPSLISAVAYYEKMTAEKKIVATGIWLYDRTAPRRIAIYAQPARFASSRYDNDDQLDESRPIPETPDGLVYSCDLTGGSHHTLDEAKDWADQQPWGPVEWD
jgi:hypothetical protein